MPFGISAFPSDGRLVSAGRRANWFRRLKHCRCVCLFIFLCGILLNIARSDAIAVLRCEGAHDRGNMTKDTVRHATAYMEMHGLKRVMTVSQYFHLARRMGIDRADIYASYAHCFPPRDVYSIWREVPAYVFYAWSL